MDRAKSPKLPFILWMDEASSGFRARQDCVRCAVIYDGSVKHVDVDYGVYGSETMSSPTNWLPALLAFLDSGIEKWNFAEVDRDSATGGLVYKLRHTPMSGLTDLWHPKLIDLRDLINLKHSGPDWYDWENTFTATYCPTPLLQHQSLLLTSYRTILASSPRLFIKIGQNDDDLIVVQREAETYKYLSQHDPDVAPKFLGHVHERGNVIGFALEYIERGHHMKSAADLPSCKSVLHRFHELGLVHNNLYEDCFIIEDQDGEKKARMVSFRSATKRGVRPPDGVPMLGDDLVEFQKLESFYGGHIETEITKE